jgi:hypothetical protein
MAVNYMDRLAALRGDRQHAAGAHGSVRSAPVLHADEEKKRAKKKKWKGTKKQRAALAKGQRALAAKRRAAKKGKSMPKRKKSRRAKPTRVTRGRKAVARRKKALARRRAKPTRVTRGRKAVARRKAERRIEQMTPKQRKAHYLALLGTGRKKKRKKSKRRAAPKRTAMSKKKRKKSSHKRKSPKRVAAGKKAARTRKRHKHERAAARRRGGGRKRRGGHKRGSHKRRGRKRGHRRSAPRRRKRGGRARRRSRGLVRRSNRSGKFVGRGGRIHGRKRRGGYHKAGRILREGYSMENPLGMSELGVGLLTGLVGYIAADLTDRYLAAGRPPLGGTLYAEATPLYSDFLRLGVGLGMAIVPLAGAHFLDGNKHAHIRAALQFFGFGAGLRTLGHLFNDVVAGQLKNNSMVGSTVQALYPHEIISQAQLAGAQAQIAKTGAAGLPENIGAEAHGLGMIPEGLAACCNASSRMLNPALSVLQPIGRSAEGGGAAANYAPPPVALPPPIERIVQQPYTPPVDYRNGGGGGGGRQPTPQQPVNPPPGIMQPPPPAMSQPPARVVVAQTPGAQTMVSAYAPAVPAVGNTPGGVNGLPQTPFGWGGEDAPG